MTTKNDGGQASPIAFRCPRCGEPSGSPCRTQGPYYVVTPFHYARRRLAADAMIAEGKR